MSWSEHRDLWVVRVLSLSVVGLAFPAAAFAVFGAGADRNATADILAVCYATGLMAGISSALWPLPSVRVRPWRWRIESTCAVFLVVSYATHLSWELGWLVAQEQIVAAPDSPLAYPWWAYIDGGDLRYANPTPDLLVMETLSVINGIVGVFGIVLWRRTAGDRRAVLLFAATAVVHLYSVALYYGAEIVAGLPSVDTTSFIDTWIKFGLANAPWAIFPWFVLYAAVHRLK